MSDNFREFGNEIKKAKEWYEEYDEEYHYKYKAEYVELNCHESYWNIISINNDDDNIVIARLHNNENGLYLEIKNQQNEIYSLDVDVLNNDYMEPNEFADAIIEIIEEHRDLKTRIIKIYKKSQYIVFVRDDNKECKYDLSTGEVIGFRGKPVKSLKSQLKNLTCFRFFNMIEDPVYKKYFKWVWDYGWPDNDMVWTFLKNAMPEYVDHERYFTSRKQIVLDSYFSYGYSEIPRGLFKLCETYNLILTNELAKAYIGNPNAFNLIYNYSFIRYTPQKMIEAMIEDAYFRHGRCSFFIKLIDEFGYNAKLLFNYVDSGKSGEELKKETFRDIYDYAVMMRRLNIHNFDRYPENLYNAHQKACEEFNRFLRKHNEDRFTKRIVLDYECEIDGFKFIYPRTAAEINKEGINQHNCVATYVDDVLDGYCHIMFMRPVDDIENSYITLEIRDNKVVQAKRKYNREPSKEEYKVIEKWNEKYKGFEIK